MIHNVYSMAWQRMAWVCSICGEPHERIMRHEYRKVENGGVADGEYWASHADLIHCDNCAAWPQAAGADISDSTAPDGTLLVFNEKAI